MEGQKGGPERAKRGAKRRGHLSSTPVYIHSIVNFYFKKLWAVFKHGVYMTLTSYSIIRSLNFLLLSKKESKKKDVYEIRNF